MTDHRIGLNLYSDVPDVLHRHGFARGDDQHAGRAIFLVGDLARSCEGSQHHPYRPSITQAPSPSGPPEPPGLEPEPGPTVPEGDLEAVTLTHAEVRIVMASLDLTADWKRDRAETCVHCTDQSCDACELRLREARTYDQLTVQLPHDEQAARDTRSRPGLAGPPIQPRPAPEREPGQ